MDADLTDSNILLLLAQPAHPEYSLASDAVDKLLLQNVDLCVVAQDLVEFWSVNSPEHR